MRALYERLRDRRRTARIMGVALSVSLLLVGAVVFIVLKSLPSTQALRSRYFSSRLLRPVNLNPPIFAQDSVSGATTSARAFPNPQAPPPTINPQTTPPSAFSLADYVTDRFVERGDRSLRVCEQLSDLRSPPPIDAGSLDRALQEQMQGAVTNPFAESALAPLGALLQLPDVGSVVREIRGAQDSGDLSLLRQAEFYSNVAYAAAEVYRNKAALDLVSEHAYHLAVLARVASLAPTAVNDATFQNFCGAVEARALDPLSVVTPSDLDAERATLLETIGANGLTPQQAGFEAGLSTQVAVSITPEAVTFSSPWMNRLYGSGLQLSARTQ